jgi:hypothetical protein
MDIIGEDIREEYARRMAKARAVDLNDETIAEARAKYPDAADIRIVNWQGHLIGGVSVPDKTGPTETFKVLSPGQKHAQRMRLATYD